MANFLSEVDTVDVDSINSMHEEGTNFFDPLGIDSLPKDSGLIIENISTPKTIFDYTKLPKDTATNIRVFAPIKNIRKKYKGPDFDYQEEAKDENIGWWERFMQWLLDKFGNIFNTTGETSAKILYLAMRIVGVLFIVFLLYKIAFLLLNENGTWFFGRKSDSLKQYSAKHSDLDIHQNNLAELLNKAVEAKDYRLAVRYSFLNTLKALENKEIIFWDAEKTNIDYLAEIKNQEQKEQFKYIVYLYNYCWYGEFEIDESGYKKATIAFNKMVELI